MSFESAGWLERPGRAEEDRPELVLAAMRLRTGQAVAEIGCGSGFFSRRLARAVAPGGRVYAEDIQPQMLDLLKERAGKEGIGAFRVAPIGTNRSQSEPIGAEHGMIQEEAQVVHAGLRLVGRLNVFGLACRRSFYAEDNARVAEERSEKNEAAASQGNTYSA